MKFNIKSTEKEVLVWIWWSWLSTAALTKSAATRYF